MGAVISGGVKHRHSILYYDENGIPWMSWTLGRMAGDYGSRLELLVKQNNPNWKPGGGRL